MTSIPRRTLLKAGLTAATGVAVGGLAACGRDDTDYVTPNGDEVRAVESRRKPGPVRDVALTAAAGKLDLGGLTVDTWTYGGVAPGTPIRIKAGEVLRARLTNRLPEPTTIHWHGLALRNDADGVPGITQPDVPAGGEHVYEFTAASPGTYWFHPHHGTQLDRGLYAPLIVEDPAEPLAYDDEWVVVLDDWLDGVAGTPDQVLAELREGMGMGGHMMMGATSSLLGGDAGDVTYPHFVLNGRLPAAPAAYRGRPGTRLRLRLVNAGGDTAFRVALGGHRLTITHTDGYPVEPVEADAVLLGMGERYDALVTLGDGVFPLVALAEGKQAAAYGLVRTGSGAAPAPTVRPAELDRKILAYRHLRAAEPVRLTARDPDRTIELKLTGGMMRYDWGFNGRPYDPGRITPVAAGERVRLNFVNTTTMWHPVHLHGHTFALADTGARMDTAIVLPGQKLPVDFDADNPGRWMIHCHNIYHAEAGMMTLLGYRR
jgi:FtsP/CotA-like multicopper oxidase with cupredoxin domain